MVRDIDVKETIEDKTSWFNVKRFMISTVNFQRPLKSLDVKEITQDAYDDYAKTHNFQIFETSKTVNKFDVIKSIYEQTDDSKINSFFNKKNWLDKTSNVVNLTFNFNPFKHIEKFSDIEGFFDQYYQYSKLLLTIPNIRTIKQTEKRTQEIIIDLKNYVRFVDLTHTVLDTKNHKPIFVPISLRFSLSDLRDLVTHYLKKQYYHYWIDFEGKSVNENTAQRLRQLFRIIKLSGNFNRTVFYATNVRREIISNTKDDKSPASDILTSMVGANIIGVNREPIRKMDMKQPQKIVEHKARVLDNNSYYYLKTDQILQKSANIAKNAILIDNEFEIQTKHFLKNNEIGSLLRGKVMLTNYRNGIILKALTTKDSEQSMDNYF